MRIFAPLFGAAVAVALGISSASATIRITGDNGGLMGSYAARFAALRHSGERVVVDGPCLSACTMLLGMLPRHQVCMTPNAVLGFHAAWRPDSEGHRVVSYEATRALMGIYPRQIRSWIARRGGLRPHMIFLRGRDLAGMYAMCR